MIKQVIVIRTDLNMRKGKMIAQGAHASMKVFFDRIQPTEEKYFETYNLSENTTMYETYNAIHGFTQEMIEWMEGSFAKIVVGCNSEQELFDLQMQADEANIVNALILDNGNTEFKQDCPECHGKGGFYIEGVMWLGDCKMCGNTGKIGKPTYTCLAIGPDKAEKIDKITGGLKLL